MKNYIIQACLIFFLLYFFSGCGSPNNKLSNNKTGILHDSLTKNNNDSNSRKQVMDESGKNNRDNKNSKNNKSDQQINGDDLVIVYTTSQEWHGGRKGSGKGTNYEICALAKQSSAILVIDKLWIGRIYHTVQVSKKFPASSDGFSANDTIFIRAADYIKDTSFNNEIQLMEGDSLKKEKTSETPVNIDPPYKYNGEALIGYTLNGQRKYKTIDKITTKPPLFYP